MGSSGKAESKDRVWILSKMHALGCSKKRAGKTAREKGKGFLFYSGVVTSLLGTTFLSSL